MKSTVNFVSNFVTFLENINFKQGDFQWKYVEKVGGPKMPFLSKFRVKNVYVVTEYSR